MNACKIIGKEFNGLRVLDTVRVIQPNGNKITKYKVECIKCGDITYKNKGQLDRYQSMGCIKCTSRITKKITLSINERNYNNYKKKVESQTHHDFNLSFEEFDNLVLQDCFYCGSKPTFPERFKNEFKNREIVNFNGIDRINSSKGYQLNNCVPCCSICNSMKSDLIQKDFLNQINKIYNFNKSSTTSPTDVAPSGGEMEGILIDNTKDYDIV